MKKLILTLALLAAGCGDPCPTLDEDEQTGGRIAIEILILQDVPLFLIRESIIENSELDEMCIDFLIREAL